MDFSIVIKKILDEKQLKQTDLCRLTGIPSSLMSAYVTGKKSPAILNAIAIADALHISLDELVGRKAPVTLQKESSTNPDLTPAEKALIKKYRCLTPEGKATVDAVIDVQYEVVKPRIKSDEVI